MAAPRRVRGRAAQHLAASAALLAAALAVGLAAYSLAGCAASPKPAPCSAPSARDTTAAPAPADLKALPTASAREVWGAWVKRFEVAKTTATGQVAIVGTYTLVLGGDGYVDRAVWNDRGAAVRQTGQWYPAGPETLVVITTQPDLGAQRGVYTFDVQNGTLRLWFSSGVDVLADSLDPTLVFVSVHGALPAQPAPKPGGMQGVF